MVLVLATMMLLATMAMSASAIISDGYGEGDNYQEEIQVGKTFVLTVDATVGGSVPGHMGSTVYPENAVVELKAVADEGYKFAGWTGDSTASYTITTITMTSSKSVTANFELLPVVEEPVIEEEVLDDVIPEALPEMPQTAGIPIEMLVLGGSALVGLGYKIKRRK